ncbi:MBL fold metallo-hydrolase [Sphingomonas oryzagri]|uniref:MBL fold metallo-hydrolase n=1 Tax=Sphingomonas oryzagri TaxID=3042314 RepID=A0ABT6N3E9_9SPHN|nr:MBL fold metallo-hydrolase [Sphingomonas oryzagri]MDH7639289.1 MBL fold metallo-hydrolase [Sphingomonas oryzagri]
MIARRGVLALLGAGAAMPFAGFAQWGGRPATKGAQVTLLGTSGGPPPHVDRSQPANLLTVDGRSYLIDAGENCGQQLMRAGTPPSKVDATLLTHLHWDHTLGLDYLMASGWMLGRTAPMPIWGPPGTADFVADVLRSDRIGEDIFRPQAPGRPPLASLYPVHEADVTAPQTLFDDGAVRVSAVANTHFAQIHSPPHDYGLDKSYAYRFDTAYGSVVFTGDTGPSDPVTRFAEGADMLVAEIVDLDSIKASMQAAGSSGSALEVLMQHMETQHLSADALGQMAQEARVKTLVVTHFVTGPHFDPQSLIAPLRRHFAKGDILLGRDLMTIPLGKPA